MSADPYEISDAYRTSQPKAVGVVSGLHEDLLRVASYQRWIIVSLLVQIVALLAYSLVGYLTPLGGESIASTTRFISAAVGIPALICGVISVFLLSLTVHENKLVGFLLAVLVLIPCIGYLVLVGINAKAIRVLRINHVEVGLFGAKGITAHDAGQFG